MVDGEYANVDDPSKRLKIIEAKECLTKGISKENKHSPELEFYFLRAILNFYLHCFNESLTDINKVSIIN
jgi:hypothetical protein